MLSWYPGLCQALLGALCPDNTGYQAVQAVQGVQQAVPGQNWSSWVAQAYLLPQHHIFGLRLQLALEGLLHLSKGAIPAEVGFAGSEQRVMRWSTPMPRLAACCRTISMSSSMVCTSQVAAQAPCSC